MKGEEEEVLQQQFGASADYADGRNEKKKMKKDDEDEEEDEGKYDKGVMELEFKKYTGKSQGQGQGKGKKNKAESAKDKASAAMGMGGGARPVAGKGKVTKEQMLTAPHSPYFEVRVGQAVFLRQAANDEYAADQIEEAIKLYERALYHCDFSDSKIGFEQTEEQKNSLQEATDPIYLNLSRCYLKQKQYQKAITNARASVHKNSSELNRTKARFLEGKALYCLKEYEKALEILEKGSQAINEETARKENTNLLQQSILQQDYQSLIQLAKEGRARHQAHDVKVWKGVLKTDDDVQVNDKTNNAEVSESSTTRGGGWDYRIVSAIAILIALFAIYFAQQR